MTYSHSLRELIRTTVGVDPVNHTPVYVRFKLETLLEEVNEIVFGHIGREKTNDDIIITSAENNSLYRVRTAYNEFMNTYEQFLEQ